QPRFATTDAALDDNASVTRHFGEQPITDFDRMIALRDRQYMREVVQLYEALHAQGVTMPSYARAAAADAYLYLQEPEKARDLYLGAIEEARAGDVASIDSWRIGLTYAYVEAEQHRKAQQTADELLATTPQFSNWGIRGIEAPNDDYPVAATLAGLVKLYSNRLKDAEQHLASLRDAAPFNPQVRTAWSELKMARGHHRAALEEYTVLHVDQPEEMGPVLGQANAYLALNEFSKARELVPVLNDTYPENKGVQRLTRLVDIYDRPHLEVTSTFGNGGGQAGAQSVVEARLYSAPLTNSLGDPWRVYSRLSHANGDINAGQANEFSASRSLIGVGVDYRIRDWTLEAEVNRAIRNANRSGVAARVIHDFSDQWQARLEADSNVNNLAARAFNAGVTARRYTAGLTWRQNESRNIDGEISNTQFSDGNRRDAAGLAWTERWYSGPRLTFDSVVSLATSRNSLPNAVYFNPSSDSEATLGLNAEWLTWRRYQRAFSQQLQVYGGRYHQKGFSSGGTSGAQYGHVWTFDDAFRIEYGVGLSNHPYDGVRERRNYGYLNLNWAIK
ncbi:MAG: poly-beta-1,6 N-acetyl-D-glucosamine export porin PgaA, partial [Oxalicibacterium faecigallinarum]|uniref:poly-beta-1,6 N-acetyl-D-glucosamine export porin PgaA n=1 Tax=Oxalicibacterium faecigallinarum TaxID=573741 RepID=UPI0028071EA1